MLASASAARAAPAPPTDLPATSWLLVDEASGDVLAADDPRSPRPIASATKLMTAYLTLRELRPSDEVIAPDYPAGPGESLMGLEPGERNTVRDLLYGLLVASGNDAALTLALRVSGSESDFVARMNRAAARLGLDKTTYADPIGLDPANASSAGDLVDLAIRLRREALFRRIVNTERIIVGSGADRHRLETRNTLLESEPFVDGVKTGTTLEAGYVLVASGRRRGVELVSAVLGAPGEAERDAATLELLDYGASLYRRRALVKKGERVSVLSLPDRRGRIALVAAADVTAVARTDQAVEVEFEKPEPPAGAVSRGQSFGAATVTLDGATVGRVEVVAARAAPAPSSLGDDGLPGWALIALAGAGLLALGLTVAAVIVARRPSQ